MNFQTKRIIKKIISRAGVFFFAIAAVMLYSQLAKHPLSDVKTALFDIPLPNVLYACAACFFGYVALASYDFLALKYIHRKLEPWKWMLAGFIGFAVSNNAGHAVVSGGAVRYRFYTRWRFRPAEILKMVTFSGFTYLIGCLTLVIIGYWLIPRDVFGATPTALWLMRAITALCLIGFISYFALALFYKNTLKIKEVSFKMPSWRMGVAQAALGAIDSLLASLVLYFALAPFTDIPFDVFVGVFVVAQVLGVFSQVPGGLGVFEGLFLLTLPGDNNEAYLFGALIIYRIIYYLLPLLAAGVLFVVYENRLKARRKSLFRSS